MRKTKPQKPQVAQVETPAAAEVKPDPDRSVLLNAWFSQRTEWSKSIFTISAAGIGLSATALLTRPEAIPPATKLTLLLSMVFFGICVISCIQVFRLSSDAIQALINDQTIKSVSENKAELKLRRWARIQRNTANLGIVSLIGAVTFNLKNLFL